ncbi:hypothetical protein [Sphingomonas sp.]|uniref:hypothetical protein n=1 Tax=Sphingomonas sp. TaxID=28214 RepID=UPI002DD620AA|nr:hypothetical protein [Sphingomonas sp.]
MYIRTWRGAPSWVTEILIGDDQFRFHAPASTASRGVRHVEKLVADEMRNTRYPDGVIDNLTAIGSELSDVLLGHDTPQRARAERAAVTEALASAKGSLIYQLGAPVPIELLSFEAPIGGVGRFANMLGSRPDAWSQNGRRPGLVVGSGAVLFHDEMVPSCGNHDDDGIMNALDVAFPNGVEPHTQLLVSDRGAAQAEIDRLFKGSTASWIHFQCHAVEDRDVRAIRLTNDYEATQSAFTDPGARVAAIMLNACSGARMGDGWGSPDEVPEGSWAEYFTGDCGVPAVIGPFCPVLDDRTMPFTREFYDRLSRESRVFRAFSDARVHRLERDDFTAFVYRYIGPAELVVPEQARLVSRSLQFSKVA